MITMCNNFDLIKSCRNTEHDKDRSCVLPCGEEIEAWLLGDRHALLSAYPHAKMHVLNTYVQDSICGTWEVLADAVYPGGTSKLSREHASFIESES